MKKSFNELVEHYYEKKSEGMDFSQIRKELTAQKVGEAEIKEIVREIDQKILKEGLKKKSKLKPRDLRIIGWILMITGGTLTFGLYFKLFDLKNFHFLAYGPVIAGYLLIVAARRSQKKN